MLSSDWNNHDLQKEIKSRLTFHRYIYQISSPRMKQEKRKPANNYLHGARCRVRAKINLVLQSKALFYLIIAVTVRMFSGLRPTFTAMFLFPSKKIVMLNMLDIHYNKEPLYFLRLLALCECNFLPHTGSMCYRSRLNPKYSILLFLIGLRQPRSQCSIYPLVAIWGE